MCIRFLIISALNLKTSIDANSNFVSSGLFKLIQNKFENNNSWKDGSTRRW